MEHQRSLRTVSLGTYSLLHFLFLQSKVSRASSTLFISPYTYAVYDRLGIAWATSLLGFISVALLPIPWILFVWGPKIRQKSAYEITEH